MKFKMRTFVLLSVVILLFVSGAHAEDFVDSFLSATNEDRLAERGDWTFKNQTASCVADPELYKRFKNHGPILKWPREFHDGAVEFEMKAEKCQRVVFTLNGDGHVFRVTLADETPTATAGASRVPTRIIAWATKSSKQNKGDTIKPDGLPDLPVIDGKWVRVRLSITGDTADLTIGGFRTQIQHAALTREKNTVMLTFAYGKLAVRGFRMSGTHETIRQMQSQVGDHRLSYLLQTPAGRAPENGWPLLLFLHGYGECGDEIDKVKKHGPPKLVSQFEQLTNCVIVSPQCPRDSWWRVGALKALVEEVAEKHGGIDQQRLYVSGLSMGGYGTWSLISHYPDYFAAAIPICGGGDPFRLPKNRPPTKIGIRNEFRPDGLKKADSLPIWTFHGTDDGSVPIIETQRLVSLLREAGSSVRLTSYAGAGHVNAWQRAYGDARVWEWLFAQQCRTP